LIWDLVNPGKFDHINRVITLSVITLRGFHCMDKIALNRTWGKPKKLFVLCTQFGFFRGKFSKNTFIVVESPGYPLSDDFEETYS